MNFKKEWNVYNLLVNLVRKDQDSYEFLKTFVEDMKEIYRTDLEIDAEFFMKILSAFYLIKFDKNNKENVWMILLQFINDSEKKITTEN